VRNEELQADASSRWTVRNQVRAFYSGHSLSDGVPEAVAAIAAARGQTWEFEFQSLGYSLLRTRTKGDAASPAWTGYSAGFNKQGSGLDVAQELRQPSRITAGTRYDALIVTERHDLPWVAATEGTPTYLADFAKRAWQGNPATDVFLYHTWLALDPSAPEPWIRYERKAQRLWECVASRANLDLGRPAHRIRVLPGGAALADLVERLWQGRVPGITEPDPGRRVGLLFVDDVHMSPVGTYFMGLVHYAVLFGQRPTGTRMASLSDETRVYFEQLAYDTVAAYAELASAAADRDMEACRLFAANEMCRQSYDLPARGWRELPLRPYRAWRCRRIYLDPTAATNPFKPS
jgi:hypothetical protein